MDDLFFYASKLIWLAISPDSLLLLALVVATGLLYSGHLLWGRRLLGFTTLLVLLLSLFPIGQWLMYPLETRFQANPPLPERVDGIIVLGGSVLPLHSQEWGQLETNSAQERLQAGIDLARRFPDARIVFSGGSASLVPGRPTEADMVREYFISAGIQAQRLLLEKEARNTAENAIHLKQMVKPRKDEAWLLVTSAYHMPRSVGLFCRLGWATQPYPVDHASLPGYLLDPSLNLKYHLPELVEATHEWVGLLAYFLTGRIDSILPGECA